MKRRKRYQYGNVYLDKRTSVWYFKWYEGKTRHSKRLGSLSEIPTKAQACHTAEGLRLLVNADVPDAPGATFEGAARAYMVEKMPIRHGGYRNWLEKYAIPQRGALGLDEVKPMAVWRWLKSLAHTEDTPRWKKGDPLAGKTKGHIKSAMRQVFEFAMLAEIFPIQRNPMELVEVKGASKRMTPKRILTYDEWSRFISFVTAEPQRTAIITCMCLGVRREEVWALMWSDFDFVNNTVMIQRSIVGGKVFPTVKTDASEAPLPLDPGLVTLLLRWRSTSQFGKDSDWVWASPFSAGEMPLYFNAIQRDYIIPAAIKAGLARIGRHCFRHTYRSWLNAAGTPLGLQKDLMRHSDISMTTQYGTGVVEAMREFNSQVVRRVIQ